MPKLPIGRKGVLKGVFFANIAMFLGLFLVVGGFVAVILIFNGMLDWSLQTWQEALVPFVALVGIIAFTFMLVLYDKLLGYTFAGKASRKISIKGLSRGKNLLETVRGARRGRSSGGGGLTQPGTSSTGGNRLRTGAAWKKGIKPSQFEKD